MTFLGKYAFGAIGFNFVLAALSIQWGMLLNGFWHEVQTDDRWTWIHLDLHALIEGDFAAGAVLITFGAVLGKTSPLQMVTVVFLELVFYSLNLYIGSKYLLAIDIGGSMFIHAFGAYFGIAMAYVLGRGNMPLAEDDPSNHNKSTKTSDTFAMIGTIFLWMFWPSFNGALAPDVTQERVFINTVVSLTGSCIGAFMWSQIRRKKLSMVDIQNATLAGGVAVGSSADLSIEPWAALLIGLISATVSVWGYVILTPFLERKCCIHDTCGVHNLHGMPGVIGGISGAIAAATADDNVYGTNIGVLYPARESHGRTAGEQAGYQFAALVITVGLAISSGVVTGVIVSMPVFEPPAPKDFFSDHLSEAPPRSFHYPSCIAPQQPRVLLHPSNMELTHRIGIQRYWDDVPAPLIDKSVDSEDVTMNAVEDENTFTTFNVRTSSI